MRSSNETRHAAAAFGLRAVDDAALMVVVVLIVVVVVVTAAAAAAVAVVVAAAAAMWSCGRWTGCPASPTGAASRSSPSSECGGGVPCFVA